MSRERTNPRERLPLILRPPLETPFFLANEDLPSVREVLTGFANSLRREARTKGPGMRQHMAVLYGSPATGKSDRAEKIIYPDLVQLTHSHPYYFRWDTKEADLLHKGIITKNDQGQFDWRGFGIVNAAFHYEVAALFTGGKRIPFADFYDEVKPYFTFTDPESLFNDPASLLRHMVVPLSRIKTFYDYCNSQAEELKLEEKKGEIPPPIFLEMPAGTAIPQEGIMPSRAYASGMISDIRSRRSFFAGIDFEQPEIAAVGLVVGPTGEAFRRQRAIQNGEGATLDQFKVMLHSLRTAQHWLFSHFKPMLLPEFLKPGVAALPYETQDRIIFYTPLSEKEEQGVAQFRDEVRAVVEHFKGTPFEIPYDDYYTYCCIRLLEAYVHMYNMKDQLTNWTIAYNNPPLALLNNNS